MVSDLPSGLPGVRKNEEFHRFVSALLHEKSVYSLQPCRRASIVFQLTRVSISKVT